MKRNDHSISYFLIASDPLYLTSTSANAPYRPNVVLFMPSMHNITCHVEKSKATVFLLGRLVLEHSDLDTRGEQFLPNCLVSE